MTGNLLRKSKKYYSRRIEVKEHPNIECPICHMKKFFKETRKFLLKGTLGSPDTEVEAALCQTCGYVLFFSTEIQVEKADEGN